MLRGKRWTVPPSSSPSHDSQGTSNLDRDPRPPNPKQTCRLRPSNPTRVIPAREPSRLGHPTPARERQTGGTRFNENGLLSPIPSTLPCVSCKNDSSPSVPGSCQRMDRGPPGRLALYELEDRHRFCAKGVVLYGDCPLGRLGRCGLDSALHDEDEVRRQRDGDSVSLSAPKGTCALRHLLLVLRLSCITLSNFPLAFLSFFEQS